MDQPQLFRLTVKLLKVFALWNMWQSVAVPVVVVCLVFFYFLTMPICYSLNHKLSTTPFILAYVPLHTWYLKDMYWATFKYRSGIYWILAMIFFSWNYVHVCFRKIADLTIVEFPLLAISWWSHTAD